VKNTLTCGSMYSVTFDAQNITAEELEGAGNALVAAADSADISNVYSTTYLGKLLSFAGKQYFAQLDIANTVAMEQYDIHAERRLGAGMTGYEVRKEYLYGQLSGIREGSLYIDIDANTRTTTSLTGHKETEREFIAVTGMMSSLYESVVWEQLTGIESVSTMSLLAQAQSECIDICILTKDNLADSLETLEVSDDLKEELRKEVASGKHVVIPQKELTKGAWTGTGYMIMDPATGAGAYMINGGLTGEEISGGAVTDEVTLYMLLGMICSFYVEVVCIAGIVDMMGIMASGPFITVVGGYFLNTLALVSMYVTLAMVYELILAYTDFLATGDINSANEVIRIANILKWEAILTIFLQLLTKTISLIGSGKGNAGVGGGGKTGKLTVIDGGNYSSSEMNAAQYMADLGNDVVLRPPAGTRVDGGTSDLLVNGVNYDVYTPTTSNPSAIIRAITKKNTQTTGIVLDLSNTTVSIDDLGNILARVVGAIEKNGGICNIKDIVVMPK
ncbi:MAG: hypothetical protein IJ429_06435, partial [Lachnospiraceae bacterium]|nr:hypothetical protein [Lachnospiraceae bacterium]